MTFGNWLQAFVVMAVIISRHQPEKAPDLFVYLYTIYLACNLHGCSAWWRYDEEFRCRLAMSPDVGRASKAIDVWIQLMLAQMSTTPFLPSTTAESSKPTVAGCRTDACWLCNGRALLLFFALCKFNHGCSICGGSNSALRCYKQGKPGGRQATAGNGVADSLSRFQ